MANPILSADKIIATKDSTWVRSSFMLAVNRWDAKQGRLQAEDKGWLYFTTSMYKYTNTSLGGNFSINSLPQFTLFADPPRGGLQNMRKIASPGTSDASIFGGMGRYYSEAIDDWSQKVSMRFGFPEYKGLITFFTSFYDGAAGTLGRSGRLLGGLFYLAGRAIGSIVALPFTVLLWVGEAVQWLTGRPSTRYYSSRPAMAIYWQRVNLIANMMAANMGLSPRNQTTLDDEESEMIRLDPRQIDSKMGSYTFRHFKNAYPNLFQKHGGIDVYYVANKTTRMHYQFVEQLKRKMENEQIRFNSGFKSSVENTLFNMTFRDPISPQTGIDRYLERYHSSRLGFMRGIVDGEVFDMNGDDSVTQALSKKMANARAKVGNNEVTSTDVNSVGAIDPTTLSEGAQNLPAGETVVPTESSTDPNNVDPNEVGDQILKESADDNLIYSIYAEDESNLDENGNPLWKILPGWGKEFVDYAIDTAREGGQWVNFRVDAVKNVSESFSNNVGPSEIQNKINSASSSVAELRFSASDFNTGFAGVDTIVQGIRDTFAGIADGLHLSGLLGLMGGGYVDIPQKWTDSSAQFPTASYTIQCRPPYGNVMSRFLNMHVPLACLLAAALPISHGRHAYGPPMLCELYVAGKNQTRLGMITSLSVTRGTGNLGWTKDGAFLGCDITFEVTDLSSVMHAPIDTTMDQFLSLRWILSDDNPFNDYMAVLSNLGVNEMTYGWEKLKLNFERYIVTQQSFLAPGKIAMQFADTGIGRTIRMLAPFHNVNSAGGK